MSKKEVKREETERVRKMEEEGEKVRKGRRAVVCCWGSAEGAGGRDGRQLQLQLQQLVGYTASASLDERTNNNNTEKENCLKAVADVFYRNWISFQSPQAT